MLTREIVQRYVGPGGSLYVSDFVVPPTQVPPGTSVRDYEPGAELAAADLLLVRAPVGPRLRDHVVKDLPMGCHVMLLLETQTRSLPVGRVLSALSGAGLQVVEATPVSSLPGPAVAVVAVRGDDLVAPAVSLADDVTQAEPARSDPIGRLVGELILERLVLRARERGFRADLVTAELEITRLQGEVAAAQAERVADIVGLRRQLEREVARRQRIEQSETFRVARLMSRALGKARRLIRRGR